MVDRNHSEISETGRSRRQILRSMGVGTIGATFLVGQASAKSTANSEPAITIVDDEKVEKKLVRIAKKDPQFKEIRKYVLKTFDLRTDVSDTRVYKKTGDERAHVVSFNTGLTGCKKENWEGDISVRIEENSTKGAFGVVRRMNNGKGTVVAISAKEGKIHTEKTNVDMSKAVPVEQLRNQGDVGIQSSLECTVCKDLMAVLCVGTCELTASFYCMLAGFTTGPGGVICAGMALVICTYIERHGCSNVYESDCRAMGYC